MTTNNTLYFNMAYAGFIAGVEQGRKITSSSTATYSDIAAAALVFATAVDAAIPNDAAVSGGGGLILPPTTDDIQGAEFGNGLLLYGICAAVMAGAWQESTTSADYSTQVAAIAALFDAANANLIIP
jgi:hypothetical protein